MVFNTKNREETVKLGEKIGRKLSAGVVVCITGELGAGKTVITSGIAKGIGVTEAKEGHITSPTFTIVNEYEGRIPFFHFDVYRVHDPDELYEIGFCEYFSRNGVICIEWADIIYDLLDDMIWDKDKYININICKVNKLDGKAVKPFGVEEERQITVTGALHL